MGRKNKQAEVTAAVRRYLEIDGERLQDEQRLDIRHVASAVGASRTTLYKYGLDEEIKAAGQRRQEQAALSGRARPEHDLDNQARQLREALQQAEARNKALVGQITLIEANAARMGIDPEELYRPIAQPDRSVSHAGRRGRGR
jgi:hypothetical protein